MKNKLSKSILATSLATAGFVVGTNQVQADTLDETKPELNADTVGTASNFKNATVSAVDQTLKTNETATSATTNETVAELVTEELVQVAKEQVEEANKQVASQVSVTETADQQLKDAESTVEEARKEVAQKEADVQAATPENIQEAKEAESAAQLDAQARQEDVATAREEEARLAADIEKQKNVVAGQQTLVDIAKENIKNAEEPIHNEKVAVEDAQKAVEKAQADLASKQAEAQTASQALTNRDSSIAQAQQKVASAQASLAATNQAIAQKEAELRTAQATPAVAAEYTYANFLDYLQGQVSNSAYANLASQARAEYAKHGSVNNSNSGSYENALAAVRILREVNKARKAAGLNELLINPFQVYESQIQLEASRPRLNSGQNPHTGIYNYNENLAWGGNPEWAVNIWQSEKAQYQQIAQRRGLPTNETQIDSGALYMTMGADFFPVGHYLQNMSNKFNVATAAFVSNGNVSQISFKSVSNLQSLINAGVVMTVDQYEAKLREFAGALRTGVSSNASKVQAELDALKAQRTGDQSRLNIANAELAAQTQAKANDSTTVSRANQAVATAQAALTQAQTNLNQQENIYNQAFRRISENVAPLQGVLKSKEADLAEAQVVLARLETAYKAAQEKTAQASQKLVAAENAVKAAQQRISDLEHASENLETAKAALVTALETYKTVAENYKRELQKLSELRLTHSNLLATYQGLQTKYNLLHPEEMVDVQHPSITAVEGLAYHGEAAQVATTLSTKVSPVKTEQAATVESPGKAQPAKQAVAQKKVLPSTGTNANDALMVAGMILGAASLAATARKKED